MRDGVTEKRGRGRADGERRVERERRGGEGMGGEWSGGRGGRKRHSVVDLVKWF